MVIRIILLVITGSSLVFAQTTFMNAQIDSDSGVLLETKTYSKYGDYTTLHYGDITSNTWEQLTVFPENLYIAGPPHKRVLMVYNQFGLFRSNELLNALTPVAGFPSFSSYQMAGDPYAILPSPDGKYILFYQPKSPAAGDVVLFDMDSQQSTVIVRDYILSTTEMPVKWSPDSQYFVYARGQQLYYFALGQVETAESFRQIGPGTLNSISWHEDGSLYYILDKRIYRFYPSQIFIGALYREIFSSELVVDYLLIDFHPSFDYFSLSPNHKFIVIYKKEGLVYLQEVTRQEVPNNNSILPMVKLAANEGIIHTSWSADDTLVMVSNVYIPGGLNAIVYRLTQTAGSWEMETKQLNNGIRSVKISPDGRHMMLLGKDGSARLFASHNIDDALMVREGEDYISMVWISPIQFVIGGRHLLESMDINGSSNFLGVSQAEMYGFLEDREEAPYIRMKDGKVLYRSESTWWRSESSIIRVLAGQYANEKYRVDFVRSNSTVFTNQPIITNLRTGTGVIPFDFTTNIAQTLYPGAMPESVVGLALDFTQSNLGFGESIELLMTKDLPVSTFINGDFIQRFPQLSRIVVTSAREVGSLFSVYTNFEDNPYFATTDFIYQNLLQFEQNYVTITGQEPAKLWHAPYYFTNNSIVEATQNIGYRLVEADFYLSNLMPTGGLGTARQSNVSVVQLINAVISNIKDGDIIGANATLPYDALPRRYQSPMFNHLTILIKALKNKGYTMLPVSELENNE